MSRILYVIKLITKLGFKQNLENEHIYTKEYGRYGDYKITVDINKRKIFYRDDNEINKRDEKICVGDETTSNFSNIENFVVLECVDRLLKKGYKPGDIWLERKWPLGKSNKSGKADINVFCNGKCLMIIECKTFGEEYEDEIQNMEQNGGQLFSYLQQDGNAQFLCLYTSRYNDGEIYYENSIVKIKDRKTDIEAYKKGDENIKLYMLAKTKGELFEVWKETFNLYFHYNGIFDDDVLAYNPDLGPLRKKNLKPIDNSQKIFYKFLEILRHNNISDNANAFNKMINLILCKIVDEEKSKDQVLDFQVKESEDSLEDIYDRLEKLYHKGMKKYLSEEVIFHADSEIKSIINKYPKSAELEKLLGLFKDIKYYGSKDFSFKEVYNKELFEENGRVLIEVIKLLQNFEFKYSNKRQVLGDFFELLLNHGVKQSEGQFFTPVPIARFIILSLAIEDIIQKKINDENVFGEEILPKFLDFACGAGHLVTESIDEIQKIICNNKLLNLDEDKVEVIEKYKNDMNWTEKAIYGIDKDYRLAKTSRLACILNGHGKTNIIAKDGLEDNSKFGIVENTFDLIGANPPYSVKAFRDYLNVVENSYELYNFYTSSSKEIETMFIERAKQLLKVKGRIGIILPLSILDNTTPVTYIKAREIILKYFNIKSIVDLGSSVFIAAGISTVILFLERRDDDFYKTRENIAEDVINNIERNDEYDIVSSKVLLKVFAEYRGLTVEDYRTLIEKDPNEKIRQWEVYKDYEKWFNKLTEVKNLKKKKSFTKMSDKEKIQEINNLFYEKILKIEKEKFLYFLLCLKEGNDKNDESCYSSQDVVVVNTGSTLEEKKAFLGYEVSKDRENQGITLTGKSKLYNDINYDDNEMVCSYIRKAFKNEPINQIDDSLKQNISVLKLVDMIDFDSINFLKAISLFPKKKMIKSKWNLVKLEDVAEINLGQSPSSKFYNNNKDGLPFYQGKTEFTEKYLGKPKVYTTQIKKKSIKDDILMSVRAPVGDVNINPYEEIAIGRGLCSIRATKVSQEFLWHWLKFSKSNIINSANRGSMFQSITKGQVGAIMVPMLDEKTENEVLQKLIKIDNQIEKCRNNIISLEKELEKNIVELQENYESKQKLVDVAQIFTGGTPSRKEKSYWENGSISWIRSEVCQDTIVTKEQVKEYITEKATKETKMVKPNSTLIAVVGSTIGKTGYLEFETAINQNIAAIYPLKPNNELNCKFLYYAVRSLYGEFLKLGKDKYKMANLDFIRGLRIPVPNIERQIEIVNKLDNIEENINKELKNIDILTNEQAEFVESILN